MPSRSFVYFVPSRDLLLNSVAGLTLFCLAGDADTGPGDGIQAGLGDSFLAIHTYSECIVVDSLKRFIDGTYEFRVCLL